MTRSGRAYPLATGSAVRCFCRNALKDRFHFRPCFLRTPGMIEAPFKAPSSPPDTPLQQSRNPFDSAKFDAAVGIFVIGVTAINRMSPVKATGQLIHQFVNRTSGTNHHHYFAGYGNGSYKFGYICIAFNFFPLARPFTKRSTTPSSTPGTVRLYTETFHPLSAILRAKFSPITARPISPMSVLLNSSYSCKFCLYMETNANSICSYELRK